MQTQALAFGKAIGRPGAAKALKVAATKALKAQANNHLKALSKTDEELRVGNYLALFNVRDLEWVRSGANKDGSKGEYFTPDTEFTSAYTKAGVFHVDWEHGVGKAVDGPDAPGVDDVLGYVDYKTAKVDETGVWAERVLNRRNQYMDFLEALIDDGLLGSSTQAVTAGIKRAKDGAIKAWPIYRDTLTVSPADWRMMTDNTVGALKNLVDAHPALKALLPKVEVIDGNAAEQGAYRRTQLRAKALLLTLEE